MHVERCGMIDKNHYKITRRKSTTPTGAFLGFPTPKLRKRMPLSTKSLEKPSTQPTYQPINPRSNASIGGMVEFSRFVAALAPASALVDPELLRSSFNRLDVGGASGDGVDLKKLDEAGIHSNF